MISTKRKRTTGSGVGEQHMPQLPGFWRIDQGACAVVKAMGFNRGVEAMGAPQIFACSNRQSDGINTGRQSVELSNRADMRLCFQQTRRMLSRTKSKAWAAWRQAAEISRQCANVIHTIGSWAGQTASHR
jgi:hypothetical protein